MTTPTPTGYILKDGRHVTASPDVPHSEPTEHTCPICGNGQFLVGKKFYACVNSHMYDLSGKQIVGV